jgi:hypothetical protein
MNKMEVQLWSQKKTAFKTLLSSTDRMRLEDFHNFYNLSFLVYSFLPCPDLTEMLQGRASTQGYAFKKKLAGLGAWLK